VSEQKFHAGDWVRVADDLGSMYEYFTSGCDAIIVASYADRFGGDNDGSYTIDIEKRGEVSWYREEHLTLIEHGRDDLRLKWEAARDEQAARDADLDWIFSHGEDVIRSARGATVAALGKILGIDNLWGSRGEGMTYYMNAISILGVAEPYLRSGDRAGFESLAGLVEQ
jgi:hypothetical protein